MSTPIAPIDLTQRPPRSMRVRFGGFVLLPRILDKGRAKLAGKNGEYNFNSPGDQHLVRFLESTSKLLQRSWTPEKATVKSSNGFMPMPGHLVLRGKSRLGPPTWKEEDRIAMPKRSPFLPSTLASTARLAKISRLGSTLMISTIMSASEGKRNRTPKAERTLNADENEHDRRGRGQGPPDAETGTERPGLKS